MGADSFFTITRESVPPTPFGYKRCSDCGEVKPVEEFSRCKCGSEARFSRCKSCISAWYKSEREKKKGK